MPGTALALATSPAAQAGGVGGGGGGTPYIELSGVGSGIDCGNDAALTALHQADFTAELWVKILGASPDGYHTLLAQNGNGSGWRFYLENIDRLWYQVWFATTSANGWIANIGLSDGDWHHVAMTYSGLGDRKMRLWLDGALLLTSAACAGSAVLDLVSPLEIGAKLSGLHAKGCFGWTRISNSVRYTATFTPADRSAPPAVDGNTVEQWNFDEGTGSTAAAQVNSPTNDGTISHGTWGSG